ncbi:hypothetical protein PVAND_015760 [Polypedilum vanderplanki]|uniref:Uncharacterized protein n=1 Tax=Polypedilum vanderplanki TaxID=319348 RepID=A0A9J6BE28_POLVA|nr:hypothetical protein PVAND_015760 [Polypedilum vanderplanki]
MENLKISNDQLNEKIENLKNKIDKNHREQILIISIVCVIFIIVLFYIFIQFCKIKNKISINNRIHQKSQQSSQNEEDIYATPIFHIKPRTSIKSEYVEMRNPINNRMTTIMIQSETKENDTINEYVDMSRIKQELLKKLMINKNEI